MFIVSILILCAIITLYLKKRNNYWKELGIPTVDANPIFGMNWDFLLGRRSLERIYEDVYERKPNESYVGMYHALLSVLFVRDPKIIHRITVSDFAHFPLRMRPLTAGGRLIHNVSTMPVDEWKTVRSKLTPTFSSAKIKKMFGLIEQSARMMAEEYLRPLARTGEAVDVKETMARYASDVIGKCVFGLQCDTLEESYGLHQRVRKTLDDSGFKNSLRFFFHFLDPKWIKLFGLKVTSDETENFFFDLLRAAEELHRKETQHRGDFVQLMLDIRDAEDSDNKARHLFTDDHIASNMYIFYFAGQTSPVTLTFVLYELALHAEIQAKLRQEIRKSIDANDGILDSGVLKKMTYLDMVISETLRLHAPAPVNNRLCTETYQLPGSSLTLRPGDQVAYSISAIHKDEKYFQNPLEFDPERFSEENKARMDPLAYMPFGSGPRICLGVSFAKMKMKICLAAILSRFKLSCCDKTENPIVLKTGGFLHAPQNQVWLSVEEI